MRDTLERDVHTTLVGLYGFIIGAVLILILRLASDTKELNQCEQYLPEGERCVIVAVPAYKLRMLGVERDD